MSLIDPTETLTLRKQFSLQMSNRFTAIKRASNTSIATNDCFGLLENPKPFLVAKVVPPSTSWKNDIVPIGVRRFEFRTDPEKIKGFMDWLREMEEYGIFQLSYRPDVGPGIEPVWSNLYIQDAYRHGILWARYNLKRNREVTEELNISPAEISTDPSSVNKAFNQPIHADRVGTLYSRVYSDLKGITEALDVDVTRILASAMISGMHPSAIAREIANKIDSVGKHRSIILARTEIIRAHHLASIQEYRNAGVRHVQVKAEWYTSRDSKVCPLCEPNDKKIYDLDEVEELIPLHAQCRCGTLPYIPGVSSKS